jgi:C1A family cysteine protease
MNKSSLVILLTLVALQVYSHPMHGQMMDYLESLPTKQKFKLWHYAFERPYDLNSEISLQKYKVFKNNLKFIKDENDKKLGYTLGLGPFTDLTEQEFLETYANLKPEDSVQLSSKMNLSFDELADSDDDHDDVKIKPFKEEKKGCDIDWSYLWDYVKDQKQCGSCWAFAVIGVIEAFAKKDLNSSERLSEQHLVECDKSNSGCRGGWYSSAFNFATQKGLYKESDYPYTGTDFGSCKTECKTPYLKISGVKSCTNNGSWKSCGSTEVEEMLETGPIATAIEVGFGLAHYRQGQWLPSSCKSINHAVIITRICKQTNGIRIRNSWGAKWGENGYGVIPYNIKGNSRMRGCGALEHAFIPTGLVLAK